jgi:hypothetical protein
MAWTGWIALAYLLWFPRSWILPVCNISAHLGAGPAVLGRSVVALAAEGTAFDAEVADRRRAMADEAGALGATPTPALPGMPVPP